MRFSRPLIALFLIPALTAPLPAARKKGPAVVDLPAPFNLQAVQLNKAVALAWEWKQPERLPAFEHFGFEVERDSAPIGTVSSTSFSDVDVPWGAHVYRVRVHGGSKERTGRVTHMSAWSEPAEVTIKVTCGGAPGVSLAVVPTRRSYSSIPALRLHLTGDVTVPKGCHVTKASYHIDSGTGILHSGALKVDSQGHFDQFVEALGPEDEVPSGRTEFTITASAEDEAGPTTSSAYTIALELENPYAPRSETP